MSRYSNDDIKLIKELNPKAQSQIINELRLLVHAYAEKPSEIFERFLLPITSIIFAMLLLTHNAFNVATYLYFIFGISFAVMLLLSLVMGIRGVSVSDMRILFNLSIASHILILIILFVDSVVIKFPLLPLILTFDFSIIVAIYLIGTLFHIQAIKEKIFINTCSH